MKYIFDYYDALKRKVSGKHLFLFLDYDGTLTPIVDHPGKALLAKTTQKLLGKLTKDPSFNVSIVSGRALSDIRKRIGLENIFYIGNHGFEMDAPGVNFKAFNLFHTREIIEYLQWEINKELMFFKGAFIEDKGISLSVHYRNLKDSQAEILKVFLNELTKHFILKNQIRTGTGKKVFEIKPPVDWDKGKAVLWLLDEHKRDFEHIMPVYIGDDRTDEDAFKALKGRGITIKVGAEEDSEADYFLKEQKEVISLLKDFLALRKEDR